MKHNKKLWKAAAVLLAAAAMTLIALPGWWLSPETFGFVKGGDRVASGGGTVTGDFPTTSSGFQRVFVLEEPPREPPTTSVIPSEAVSRKFKDGSVPRENISHDGKLIYYSWLNGEEPRTREPSSSVRWPEAVRIPSREVVVNLGTEVMPQRLDVLLYDELGPGGIPDLEAAYKLSCLSGVFKEGTECSVKKRRDPKSGKWTIKVPMRHCQDKCYMAISSVWISAGDPIGRSDTRPVQEDSASWIFSLDVR